MGVGTTTIAFRVSNDRRVCRLVDDLASNVGRRDMMAFLAQNMTLGTN